MLEYDGTTGALITALRLRSSAGLKDPAGLVFGPNGNLFVSSSAATQAGEAGDQVLDYDGSTGAPISTGVFVPSGSAGLSEPTFLTFGPPAASPVPAPSSIVLLCIGVACLVSWRWRVIQEVVSARLGFARE